MLGVKLDVNKKPQKIVTAKSSERDENFYGFIHKLTILVVLITIFVITILIAPQPVRLVPQFFLGMMFAHGVELQHELTHHVIFSNERQNRFFAIILGLPMLVSFSLYKAMHGHHHSALGTSEDKETFNYNYEKLTSIPGFILHVSMLGHYSGVLENMRVSVLGKLREDVSPQVARRIRKEFCLMVGVITFMVVFSVLLRTSIFFDIWLLPLFLAAGPVHALIELPEHLNCNNHTTDPFQNTRTIRASKLISWYVNGNNYHVEHHVNAALPINKLADFHHQIASNVEHLELSYWMFYQKLFQKLLGEKTITCRNEQKVS